MTRWLSRIGGAVIGVLLLWLKIVTRQRNRARDDADRERQRADTGEARRNAERRVGEAQQQAREEAAEAARDENIRKGGNDRSGGLDNRRLRDE